MSKVRDFPYDANVPVIKGSSANQPGRVAAAFAGASSDAGAGVNR